MIYVFSPGRSTYSCLPGQCKKLLTGGSGEGGVGGGGWVPYPGPPFAHGEKPRGETRGSQECGGGGHVA